MRFAALVPVLSLVFSLAGAASPCAQEAAKAPVEDIKYIDTELPGEAPVIFAPGVVSTDAWEAAGTFSPDFSEFFFTRRATHEGTENRVMYMRRDGEGWSRPELAPFAVECVEYEPHITPDGSRLYFNSRRPHPETGLGDRKVWYSERTEAGWSEARLLGDEVNRLSPMYVSSTSDGTLYFGAMEGRRYWIFRSVKTGGGFGPAEYLPDEVNGLTGPSHPFIAPDESYLIFDAYTEGMGKSALYISVRGDDGSWSPAVKLGTEINATQTEIAPSVSPDGRFFFFQREGEIYWASASVLKAYGVLR